MQNILLERVALVHIIYRDGTELCFKTTLNVKVLAEKGIVLQPNHLPNLDKPYVMNKKQEYKHIPLENVIVFEVVDKPIFKDKKAEALSAFL